MKRRLVTLAAAAASLLLSVAIALLWLWNPNNRRLPGGYVLEHFEGGVYYVTRDGALDGGGVLDGSVERIGWSEGHILAKVNRVWDRDPDGWYVLNVRTGAVRGPMSEAEIAADATLHVIRTRAPGEY